MAERNEINLERMHGGFVDVSESYENQEFLDSQFIDVTSPEDTFPWLVKFNKMIRSSVGSKSSQLLERLLVLYTQNILTSINTYCEKALDMMKLKNHINNTLTVFHLYWRDIKEYVNNYNSYLNEMSVLLGIYIDMELKIFMHSKDSSSIATKLLSALWIYLDNSEKHIFGVLLKLKLITKKYMKICDPIFRRSFISLKRDVESLTDVDYVRYLLALKLWKRMKENLEERKKVNKMALMILGPRAPKMRDELSKIIPKPPISQENETLWLLQPNVFDLQTACNNFLAFEESMSVQFKDSYSTTVSDLTHFQKPQISSSCGVNHFQECITNYKLNKHETCNSQDTRSSENTIDSSKVANKICSAKRRSKFKKHRRASKLKPGEILLVNLTEDDESLRVDKNKSRKTRCKRKLEWLKMMKKKYKAEKQVGEVKGRNQVEIADAHSTENSENSVDKILLEYLPISDNKVSESTESCTSVEEEPLGNDTRHVHSQNMHDYVCDKRSKQLKGAFQHKQCDNCASPLKQNDVQHSRVSSLLKLLNIVGQNVKEPIAASNVLRESSEQNVMSSQHTVSRRNTADEASEVDTRDKEELFPQPKCSIETILLSRECQNSIVNTQPIKQELPASTDCNTTEADTCRHDASVYVQSDCHLHGFRSMNSHSSQATEAARQRASYDAHECTSCCKNTEVKPFFCHNCSIFNTKNEDTTQNGVDGNSSDKKPICDKSVICMLSDLDKCMDVLNRVGEHIMTVHAEKQRLECSDKTDMCAVPTRALTF